MNSKVITDAISITTELTRPSSNIGLSEAEKAFGVNSLKAVIENYIKYYASGDNHTARAKRYDLEYFLLFLAGSATRLEQVQVSEWTMQSTKDFVDSRLTLGESPSTAARRLATIKHFGRTLAERLPGYINPAREVKSPMPTVSKPQGLTEDEINTLREAATIELSRKSNRFSTFRNRFLLELLLATGLRADEVRLLVFGQLTDDHRWFRNVKTKGKRFRNVYLDGKIRDHLEEYLSERSKHLREKFPEDLNLESHPKLGLLVSSYKAHPSEPTTFAMDPKSIWNAISTFGVVATSLNQKIHIHPHRLRHTFAHGLLESSKDIRIVAQALGHSDVRTTMRYTERTDEQIAAAIEERNRK